MPLAERDCLLKRIENDKAAIALDLAEVRAIDNRLADEWGIRFPGSVEAWSDLLDPVMDRAAVSRFIEAHDTVARAMVRRRKGAIATGHAVLYDALADPAVLGPVTSRRRHFILDGICVTIGLARTLHLEGAILDVGCHAGFATKIVCGVLDRRVVGIDPSASAIALGRSYTSSVPHIDLVRATMPWKTEARFDMAIAIDTMPEDAAKVAPFLRGLSDVLNPGGLAVISSAYWGHAEIDLSRRQLKAANLGFGYADVVGGYGDVPLRFDTTLTLVLIKGGARTLPRDFITLSESEWPLFRDYANTASTPVNEKTQAFERALRRAKGLEAPSN